MSLVIKPLHTSPKSRLVCFESVIKRPFEEIQGSGEGLVHRVIPYKVLGINRVFLYCRIGNLGLTESSAPKSDLCTVDPSHNSLPRIVYPAEQMQESSRRAVGSDSGAGALIRCFAAPAEHTLRHPMPLPFRCCRRAHGITPAPARSRPPRPAAIRASRLEPSISKRASV